EQTISLHQRDNDRLINTLKQMRDLDNTLIVGEHDEDTMLAADWLIDIGPGAGEHGGEIVASGTPKKVMNTKNSLTGNYLSGEKSIHLTAKRRKTSNHNIEVVDTAENNMKNESAKFPIG